MGLFLTEVTPARRPPVSAWAVVSLIVAVTGFLNIVGFLIGPVLAHIALWKLRGARKHGVQIRGRRLAIAAICISYGVLITAVLALLVVLITAYAALPQPHFHFF